jgi:hypothetical protein
VNAARVVSGFLYALLLAAFALPPVRRLFLVEPAKIDPPT